MVLGLAHCDTFGKGLGQGQPLGTRRSAAPAGSVMEVHWAWKWVRQQARHEVDCYADRSTKMRAVQGS